MQVSGMFFSKLFSSMASAAASITSAHRTLCSDAIEMRYCRCVIYIMLAVCTLDTSCQRRVLHWQTQASPGLSLDSHMEP